MWLEVEVCRNDRIYRQEYARGEAITPVREISAATGRTGTLVRFLPDPEIFGGTQFDYSYFEEPLREMAFLTLGLHIELRDDRTGQRAVFIAPRGLVDFVTYLNRDLDVLHPPIFIQDTIDQVRIEIALQYTTGAEERIRYYANHSHNRIGGTHRLGFQAALTHTLKSFGREAGADTNILNLKDDDIRVGLTAVVSVQLPEPQFESQSKLRLNNPEVQSLVAGVVRKQLGDYLAANPKVVARIMKKITRSIG
jgi:DNA gyrase subunit B